MAIKLTETEPPCGPLATTARSTPNGVLAEVCDACWGTFCQHGIKIMEVTPETQGKGLEREGRIVDPWPCPECTREQFEAELAEAEAAYWDAQRPDW
jgi:hypothetical protein